MNPKNYFKPTGQFICRISYLLALMAIVAINSKAQVVTTITASGSFTVPAGVTSLKVEAWGTGGSGGGATGTGLLGLTIAGGGGGGGGAFNVSTLAVAGGQVYSITIGAIGSTGTGNGGGGGATVFTGPGGSVTANGGAGGGGNNGAGGAGGISFRNGGAGGNGAGANGAGGGGGAGNNTNGTAGTNTSAGTGGTGIPNIAPYIGGNGGASQGSNGSNGNTGIIPGGGGGGGRGYVLDNANGGAGARGQVVLTYTLPPPVITSLGAAGGCTGSTITINGSNFTGTVAANVQIGGTPVAAIISNNGSQIVATIGSGTTGTVSVTTTSGTATSAATFSVFSLPPQPVVTPPSATVIAGQTASFTASGTGVSFAWYSAATGGILLSSVAAYTPPLSCANATFFAEQTSVDGCISSRNSTTLTRTPLAAPTAVNGTVCGLGAANISTVPAAGGNSSNWYDAPSGGNLLLSNATSASVTINASGSYTFYASTVSTGAGCESTARTAVTATSLPEIFANPAASPASVCPGAAVSLLSGVSRSGKNTVNFSLPDFIPIFNIESPVNSPITVSGLSSSLNNNTVKINYVKINVTHTSVHDLRIRLVAPDNTFFTLVPSTNAPGANYTNTVFQGGGIPLSSGTPPYTGTFAPAQAFGNFNGKNPNGTWNLNLTDMLFLDAGTLLDWEINFIDQNGISYSWTSTPPGFSSSSSNPSDTPVEGTVYNLSVSGPGGCSASGSVAPAVAAVPIVSALSNAPVCTGSNLALFGNNLAAGQSAGNNYSWTGPGTYNSSQQNPFVGIVSPVNSGLYTLTITNQFGCTSSSAASVVVNPNPVLSVASVTNAGCIGSTDGCVDIDASGGTSPYIFNLDGNSTLDGIYCGLAAGIYNASVIDDNGCENNVNASVIEEDLIAPQITCPADVTVNNTPGLCEGIAAFTAPVGTDNCIGAVTTLAGGFPSGSSFAIGTTPVTYTVTDAFNNSATCSFNVTVVDNENPVITCPADVTVNNTPGLCEGIAVFTAPVGIDNCIGAVTTLAGGSPSGSSFAIGTTPVTYTVTDAVNNSTTCSFNVIVVDNENPVITCPADVTVNNTPGLCEGIATFTAPVGTDNCIGAVTALTTGLTSGSSFPVGTTPVAYTVTDASNNPTTCSFNVIVVDNENPVITCPANVTVNNTPGLCEGIATFTVPVGTDNCIGAVTALTTGLTSGSSFPVGTTPVAYTVTDASNNPATCSFNVIVVDNENPVITCPVNVTVNNTPGLCEGVATFTAPLGTDNCLGAVTSLTGGLSSGSSFPVGITPIEYTVTDAYLNTATCSFNVIVIDNQNPTITCPSDTVVNNDPGFCSATLTGLGTPMTGDNCSVSGITNNGVNPFPVGATIVDYEVSDLAGNKATCQQFVIVQDVENPTISGMPANIIVTADPTDCNPSVSWTAPTANDNCSISSLTPNYNPGDNFPEGTTTVVYTAIDINGNSVTSSFTVTVLTQPLVVATSSPTYQCGYNVSCNGSSNGSASASVSGGCLPYTYVWSNGETTQSVSPLAAGTYTVTVTDDNGHVTVQSVTLTQPAALSSTLGPDQSYEFSCTCASLVPVTTGGAACQSYTYAWSTGASTSSLTVCPSQTNNYTVTVTDANGCTTSDQIIIIKSPLVTNLDRYVVMGTGTATDNIGADYFITGGVGHRLATGSLNLQNNASVNTFAAGNNVILGNNSVVGTLYRNTATVGNNAFVGTTVTPVTIPLTTKVPCFPTFSGGANVNVASFTTATISPGTYNNIILGNQSTLKLNPGVYNVNSISTGNVSQILPNGAATAKDIIVFVKTTVNVGNNNNMHGSYYAQGAVNLANGNNTTGTFIGAFLGKPVSTGNGLTFTLDAYCYSDLALCNSKVEGETAELETLTDKFSLFPNPSTGEITIQYVGETGHDINVSVLDVLGQVLYERTVYEFSGELQQNLDLKNLNQGVYFIQLRNGNQLMNKQFIIAR